MWYVYHTVTMNVNKLESIGNSNTIKKKLANGEFGVFVIFVFNVIDLVVSLYDLCLLIL